MTVIVHHLENSRSQRILWLLEELQIPYEIKHYARDAKAKYELRVFMAMQTMMAPKELKAVHPLGKSPVITDGDLTVAESGLIVDYLINKYGNGKLAPARSSEAQRLRYEFWLHYAEGSLAPLLVFGLVMNHAGDAAPWGVKSLVYWVAGQIKKGYADKQLKMHVDFLEAELSKSTWFAGEELTGADVIMSFPVEVIKVRGTDFPASKYPKVHAFAEHVHARPAYKVALGKGGKYNILK